MHAVLTHVVCVNCVKDKDGYRVYLGCGLFKGLIMDGCVLLTSTPECVVSLRRVIPRAQPEGSPRGETTHEGVDVNNTHPSMINPDNNMILANLTLNYQLVCPLIRELA